MEPVKISDDQFEAVFKKLIQIQMESGLSREEVIQQMDKVEMSVPARRVFNERINKSD